ncbi:hypothetical protein tinsulaeT_18890 [Thalassotalea insulae]|uniref:Uncharacterized protein n=1 Tax=Thalassotalea insulae TaxID=2056778 RepID=A0ABQ6GTR8_9GAMM|nr:hypothetical protein [Thalassotalea insulae]GLX78549.1 hypothetical protein tinsulaeT_18890 [Thalassotalea insulae]
MAFSQQQIEALTESLRLSLGDNINWSYDERNHAMLSEFAQNKAEPVLHKLRLTLTDEWQGKSWKKMPQPLKQQLGSLTKLSKHQRILALSGKHDSPTIVALWWPWDHGGTYSLRLKLFTTEYHNTPEQNSSGVFTKLKRLFTMS